MAYAHTDCVERQQLDWLFFSFPTKSKNGYSDYSSGSKLIESEKWRMNWALPLSGKSRHVSVMNSRINRKVTFYKVGLEEKKSSVEKYRKRTPDSMDGCALHTASSVKCVRCEHECTAISFRLAIHIVIFSSRTIPCAPEYSIKEDRQAHPWTEAIACYLFVEQLNTKPDDLPQVLGMFLDSQQLRRFPLPIVSVHPEYAVGQQSVSQELQRLSSTALRTAFARYSTYLEFRVRRLKNQRANNSAITLTKVEAIDSSNVWCLAEPYV